MGADVERVLASGGVSTGLWIVASIAAIAYLWLTGAMTSTRRTVIKATPLLAFAAIAALNGTPVLLVVALVLSAVGDIALSRDGQRAFLVGLVAFAIAHLGYLAVFAPRVLQWQFAPIIVLAGAGFLTILKVIPKRDPLTWPARAYAVIICLMTAAAVSLPVGLRVAALGAVLFLLSDLILAIRMFHLKDGSPRSRLASYVLWVFYVGGQGLILFAFL
ncbi:lysoplasmalogenase [Celeribacter sp.]|uniref:lysoplasmalogenase n=1 Tax=Celeribacter sp. TaxID=1890673 RepID=UPI003A9119AF